MQLNQRLDRALCPGRDPKLVVAGEIVAKEVKRWEPPTFPGADVKLGFRADGVILGKQGYRGQVRSIPATFFMWPQDLVAFKEGVFCILVLRHEWRNEGVRLGLSAVVPARRRSFKSVRNAEEAKRVLAGEILAELKAERSEQRQHQLLLQVAPILVRAEAPAIAPFLKSENLWVRRAALAGLIWATEEQEYLRLAAQDVQTFFTTTKRFDHIVGPDRGQKAAYHFLFKHYHFLDKRSWTRGVCWSRGEATRSLRILGNMLKLGIIDEQVAAILKPREPTWLRETR